MKKSENKLFKNTVHLYILTIVKMIFPLLTLPYLARVLSKDAYGVVTYVKTWMQYVQLLIDFGFILSTTKLIVENINDKKIIGRIIGDTLVEKCLLSFFAFCILMLASFNIQILIENIKFVIIYYFAIFLTVFLFDFLFRGIEEMEKLSIPLIISKMLSTLLTFIFVKSDKNIINIAYLELFGNLIAVMISLYYVKRKKYYISFSNFKKWFFDLKQSFAYFLSNFSTTVFGALTTVITGINLSPADVASWGLCMQIINAVKSIYSPIINGIYPYMLREKNIKLVKKINIFIGFFIFLGVFIIIFLGEKIIILIAGEKYVSVFIIIKILIPVLVFSFYSMIYGWPVLGSIGKVKETTYTTVLSAMIQILLICLLIVFRIFNLENLALITSISEFSLFIFRYLIYLKHKKDFNN